jgi:hypothetical protein
VHVVDVRKLRYILTRVLCGVVSLVCFGLVLFLPMQSMSVALAIVGGVNLYEAIV